jgi:hypothetical protein
MNAYEMKTGLPIPRQRNPVRPDSWLMPGGCTDIEPPDFNKETHQCRFDGDQWVISEIPQPEPEPEPYIPTYANKRFEEYGTTEEQIEFITENGLEAWQSKVAEIKQKYPKE